MCWDFGRLMRHLSLSASQRQLLGKAFWTCCQLSPPLIVDAVTMLFLSTKVKFVILPVVISAEFAWEENKRCLLVNQDRYIAQHRLGISVWSLSKPRFTSFLQVNLSVCVSLYLPFDSVFNALDFIIPWCRLKSLVKGTLHEVKGIPLVLSYKRRVPSHRLNHALMLISCTCFMVWAILAQQAGESTTIRVAEATGLLWLTHFKWDLLGLKDREWIRSGDTAPKATPVTWVACFKWSSFAATCNLCSVSMWSIAKCCPTPQHLYLGLTWY